MNHTKHSLKDVSFARTVKLRKGEKDFLSDVSWKQENYAEKETNISRISMNTMMEELKQESKMFNIKDYRQA